MSQTVIEPASLTPAAGHTPGSVRTKLFIMMVLELAVWGAWFEMVFGYLGSSGIGFSPMKQSWILALFPLSAIVGMFFSNQFADRNFAAERFLSVSHLIGGLAMIGLSFIQAPAGTHVGPDGINPAAPFLPFFALMAIHCFFYVPTLSIANSVAFASMKDAQQEFGIVRMGGTVGWVLAATPFVFLLADWGRIAPMHDVGPVAWIGQVFGTSLTGEPLVRATTWTFLVSGILSLALSAFSLTLPHTPPKPMAPGESRFAWLVSFKLLASPFVLLLWVVTFIDAALLQMYFSWTGRFLGTIGIPANFVALTMKLGQVAEIVTMIVLGMVLKRLGWKWTMVLGILGHTVRFTVFALAPAKVPVVASILLHGVCYAFFFATVYIFVDGVFPKDIRSSAQGLFNVMILGMGPLAVNLTAPWLFDKVFTQAGVTHYRSMFLVASGISLVAAILLALAFHPPERLDAEAA